MSDTRRSCPGAFLRQMPRNMARTSRKFGMPTTDIFKKVDENEGGR